jgi:hypothetical protein
MREIRASLGFEGTLTDSKNNMISVWKECGIKYFWTWTSEDFAPRGRCEINLLHNGSGSFTPTPLYWRHPTSRDLVIWAANECPLDAFTEEAIDALIAERGVSIHHHYYPYVCDNLYDYGFVGCDQDGLLIATDKFNDTLRLMARRCDAGELLITTVGKLLDYWMALESVRFHLMPPNRIILENTGASVIEGLTFVVNAIRVSIPGIKFCSRSIDRGDLLVWLDMPAQCSIEVRVFPHNE